MPQKNIRKFPIFISENFSFILNLFEDVSSKMNKGEEIYIQQTTCTAFDS